MYYQSSCIQAVRLSGILDGTRLGEVRQKIEALDISPRRIVLVDLSNVEFMDSSGLSALIMALKYVRSLGSELYLCSPIAQVKVLLELTSMNQLFSIYESQEDFERSCCIQAAQFNC